MTRQRASVACLALLLMVARQQQPHLAAAPGSGDPTLPTHLAETGLFAPDGSGAIAAGNRPFSPQYPLWTDGAAKRRWVYLPAGTTIDASNPRQWEFPVGTRFWKEFSFAGRRVETRVLWKTSDAGWLAGSYVWNKDGTDAVLAERRRRRRDGNRSRTAAQHPVAHRLRGLPRRGAASARLQSAATVERSRSERDSRRAADAGHGHAADADRRGSADRSGSARCGRHRRASPQTTRRRAPCSDTCRATAAPVTTATDKSRRSCRRSLTPTSSMADAIVRQMVGQPPGGRLRAGPKGRC